MGGGGRRRSSSSSSKPQAPAPAPVDNSMQLWAAEMDKQRKYQTEQYDAQTKRYDDLRKEEQAKIAADNAKREQELWNEKQMVKDAAALDQYKGATENYAQQVGSAPMDISMEDSTTSAINKRIGDKSKSSAPAPGLTPFGTNIVKPANQIYQAQQARMGGM
jgi:microsomal dipeptidase-like Zn-dependent dipeptidase